MFRRIIVLDRSALPSLAAVRALAPGAAAELVVEEQALPGLFRPEAHERGSPGGRAPLDAGRLVRALGLERGDLVVVGPRTERSARARADLVVRLAIQHGLSVLSVGSRCPAPPGPARHLAFLSAGGAEELVALSALLPRFAGAAARLSGFLLYEDPARRSALQATLRAGAPDRLVSVIGFSGFPTSLAQSIDRAAVSSGVDLVVVPSDAVPDAAALAGGFFAADALQAAERPTLVLPRTTRAPALLADRLAAADTLALPGSPRWTAVERDGPLGRMELAAADRVLADGRALEHDLGVVALPPGPGGEALLGLERAPQDGCRVRIVAPTRPLVLVDARSPVEVLAPLQPFAEDSHLVFVRLRWEDPLERLRHRLAERAPWTGVPLLVDASAWLGDGGASDLPEAVDPIRLRRLAARLSQAGASLRAVVGGAVERPWPVKESGGEDLSAQVVSAERVEGNAVRFDLDNAHARDALLQAIAHAERTVHWQCYIVEEGAVAERFAAALAEAAGRGVQVRLLIDALYSRHDVFHARNPVLQKLDAVPGIDVCAYRPVEGVPDLVALKQRNHRKLVVVDDALAVVTGRNLGAPYYTGFSEVPLTRTSSYRDVPWLDCGATVRGPVVSRVQRAFLASWVASGGAPFTPGPVAPPAGFSACRFVLHDGLRDTNTFDAQLDLVRRARERLVAVNAFPLAVELQRALVEAARRGVRVQVLFGSARPRYGDDRPFGGGVIRELADRLIRARLDPVLRAGGEVGELVLPPQPGWEPALGRVFPYVHAKVLLRDGEEAAVGSANFDVTSAYWESEALLMVEDRAAVGALLAELEPLLATARRADAGDERWQREASQRARLDKVWPTLVG